MNSLSFYKNQDVNEISSGKIGFVEDYDDVKGRLFVDFNGTTRWIDESDVLLADNYIDEIEE